MSEVEWKRIEFASHVGRAGISAVECAGFPHSGRLLAGFGTAASCRSSPSSRSASSGLRRRRGLLWADRVPSKLFIALIIVVLTGTIADLVRSVEQPTAPPLGAGPIATAAFVIGFGVGSIRAACGRSQPSVYDSVATGGADPAAADTAD